MKARIKGRILQTSYWVYNFPKDSLLINSAPRPVLCILTLTKQAAERRVCGVIGVPLRIMAGRGNPVLLRTTGWGRKTFGAVTAVQLCRRERNTFTCKPMSGITDSVNAVKL